MKIDAFACIFVGFAFGILVGVGCGRGGYEAGHRQGQIDALAGHATVELRDQPDGTRAWVEKK